MVGKRPQQEAGELGYIWRLWDIWRRNRPPLCKSGGHGTNLLEHVDEDRDFVVPLPQSVLKG